MPLQKVKFAPGVVSEITPFAASNGWIDSQNVRFRAGYPETIGGWSQIASGSTVLGVCRSLHEWSSLFGSVRMGIGTHLKFYILNSDAYYDITPQRPVISLSNNPFLTVSDPTKLQVSVPFHNAIAGDFITFSGASSACGNYSAGQLNVQFQVSSVTDLNTLVLIGTIAAGAAGQTGGGASVKATPEIQTGPRDAAVATGFGINTYGIGTFGTARTPLNDTLSQVIIQPRIWFQDNFGEDLIINPRGGGIYIWHGRGGLAGRATLLSNDPSAVDVPKYSNGVFVSVIDQNLVAMGCSPLGSIEIDPMQIRWTDQANPYLWTPTSQDVAGGMRLPSGSQIIAWLPTYQETLIWTDTTMYTMQFVGGTFVYSFNVNADGLSIISPKAAVTNGSSVFWMDRGSFYTYNGSVQELPCSLKAFVFSNINYLQSWKIFAAHNHAFSEVWWFYPSTNSTEVDSYVIFNYRDNVWSKGTMPRTAWSDSGRLQNPVAVDPSGLLYFHESGADANGSPMPSWVTSGDLDIDNGETFILLKRIIPDVTFTGPGSYQKMLVDVMKRNSSGDQRVIEQSLDIAPSTAYLDSRVRGRRLSLKFHNENLGTGWRLGECEADIYPNGRR